MQSNGYGAESGRAGGAIVNVVTKSGTNHFQGTGFHYLKDSALAAAPAFVGFKPDSMQHQFGGTSGGPIARSRTLFFVGYDQHIFHVPAVMEFLNGSTVVTPQLGMLIAPGDYEDCDPAIGGMAMTQSISCPYPPCINDVVRPMPQLGASDQFESAASSVYPGMTVSLHKRMSRGVYFRVAYTWAHSLDDGQDALVAGQPVTVQNSYSTKTERRPSVTDQRRRLSVSWITEPRPFDPGQGLLASVFDH